MPKANLLITFDPNHTSRAEEEVKYLLKQVGEESKFEKSEAEGVFLVKVKDAKKAVKDLANFCKQNPSDFVYTFHYVPIDVWTSSKIEDMLKVIKDINSKMDPKKRWKIDVVKRHYEMSNVDLIKKLTAPIDKPNVDLKNPQVIIKVEIIGKDAGLSLLWSDEILFVPKIKE